MDFWKSARDAAERARQAAERAAVTARAYSMKGMEFAEAQAGEAQRRIKDMGIYDKVQAVQEKVAAPKEELKPAELAFYGITDALRDLAIGFDEATFRDFADDDLVTLSDPPHEGTPAHELNAWQVRHAVLVCRAVSEVSRLRFTLCPHSMEDERFWHVYFSLARRHLPDTAYSWGPKDKLPDFGNTEVSGGEGPALSVAAWRDQLRQLGTRIQEAGTKAQEAAATAGTRLQEAAAQAAANGPVVDLPKSFNLAGLRSAITGVSPGTDGTRAIGPAAAGAPAARAAGGATAGAATPRTSEGLAMEASEPPLFETDPDLEAYLQVASDGDDDEDDDVDFDSYLDELSAEVEAQEKRGSSNKGAQARGGGGEEEGGGDNEWSAPGAQLAANAEEGVEGSTDDHDP